MNEFTFIYVFVFMIAFCIAGVVIINIVNKPTTVIEGEEDVDFFTKLIRNREHMLKVSMPSITIKTYLILSLMAPVVFGLVFWIIFPNKFFALIMAAFSILLPDFVIRIIIDSRRKKYEEKFARALKAFSSGMRAGLTVQQSVRDVTENEFIAPEIREGFRQIDADLKVGISIEEAFKAFAEKADNNDARDVASAIAMQTAVGGSEAKVVESIAQNIDARLMTKKKIRSIFASTDFMVKVMDVMPFFALILMYLILPDSIGPILNEFSSLLIMTALLVFSLFGSVVIRRKIRNAKGE